MSDRRRELALKLAARLGDTEGQSLPDGPVRLEVSKGEAERIQATDREIRNTLAARKRERELARAHLRRPSQRPILYTRRSHGTRLRPAAAGSRRQTASQGTQSGGSDPHSAGEGDPPPEPARATGGLTFEKFQELTAGLDGGDKLRLFLLLAPEVQQAAWDALARELTEGGE